ncbi:MAG: hypothetical protein Q8P59_14755 [Dehalococcoidia bacterium]|nr:hypothetical protein [Dehalococcoidia bacterium]
MGIDGEMGAAKISYQGHLLGRAPTYRHPAAVCQEMVYYPDRGSLLDLQ